MGKNIVVCLDGTGNQLKARGSTNVVRFFELLDLSDPAAQIAYYDPGVGTFSAHGAWTPAARSVSRVLGLAIGNGMRENLGEAYRYLMGTWEPGDRLYIFGFSRNADNLGWFGWLGVVRVVVGTGRWRPAGAADGCRLGGPDDHDRGGRGNGRLRPGPMLGALDAKAGHLALDHPREGPQPPDGQQLLGDLVGHTSKGPGRWLRGERPPARWW
jgi:hypothetical protein